MVGVVLEAVDLVSVLETVVSTVALADSIAALVGSALAADSIAVLAGSIALAHRTTLVPIVLRTTVGVPSMEVVGIVAVAATKNLS